MNPPALENHVECGCDDNGDDGKRDVGVEPPWRLLARLAGKRGNEVEALPQGLLLLALLGGQALVVGVSDLIGCARCGGPRGLLALDCGGDGCGGVVQVDVGGLRGIERGGLCDGDNLDVEVECGVGGDDGGHPPAAVGVLWRHGDGGRVTDRHGGQGQVPAFDDGARADGELERSTALGGVEHLACLGKPPGVVDRDGIAVCHGQPRVAEFANGLGDAPVGGDREDLAHFPPLERIEIVLHAEPNVLPRDHTLHHADAGLRLGGLSGHLEPHLLLGQIQRHLILDSLRRKIHLLLLPLPLRLALRAAPHLRRHRRSAQRGACGAGCGASTGAVRARECAGGDGGQEGRGEGCVLHERRRAEAEGCGRGGQLRREGWAEGMAA
mmetsp:Transcript_1389/g.3779  ORF Transcript_1389/g.3779 Transcript_1389/m.3779 type:complete len:383 (+) Transcript_1389:383-1531(+)